MRSRLAAALAAAGLLVLAGAAQAQDDAGLAQRLTDPIAPLANVRLQYDRDRQLGTGRSGSMDTMVGLLALPFRLDEDWQLVARIYQPAFRLSDGQGSQAGLGDMFPALFFMPARPAKGLSWGAGAVFQLRTAPDERFANEKWGLGPTAAVSKREGPWTYGILLDHLWSVAGSERRPEYSQSFLQPMVHYTAQNAWTYGLSAEAVYDWKGHQWSAPAILTASRLQRVAGYPVVLGAGLRYWIESPPGGPREWGLRMFVTLPFSR
jgi:hypothetical protein